MATTSAGSREPHRAADAALRSLPSVERLATELEGVPHATAVRAARAAIDAERERIRGGASANASLVAEAHERARLLLEPSPVRVINATGVIVHTNLGRAPLAREAIEGVARAAGYSSLEYDLDTGARGSRQAHVEGLLRELTGAEAATAVNNGAAAVLLAAAALAAGREIVVSRGQLVEIGGAFRIPDVVAQSGARLVEVGTTNRTRLSDYERAFGEATGAVLRAHQSNFRTVGFVEQVDIRPLCAAAAARGIPVIDDVGSGAMLPDIDLLRDEPVVGDSVAAGCTLVCFSGDKLLGGPQAGLIVGSAEAVAACRSHPLARAVRIDKLSLAALEATLRLYRDPAEARTRIPVLRMLAAAEPELGARSELMRERLTRAGVDARCVEASARAGGGALPLLDLHGPVCSVDPGTIGADELAASLRRRRPPVIGRIRDGRLLLDPRTLDDAEAATAADAVAAALGGGG